MLSQDEQWLLDEKYHGEKTDGFFTDCERLKSGEPLGFIIGSVPFLDTTIHLDSHTLIPRSETEYWVEKAIKTIRCQQSHPESGRDELGGFGWGSSEPSESSAAVGAAVQVLDLCAGSGAIGIAVANAIPGAHVTFGEVDIAHLPTIGKNLAENDISCTRYKVFHSDLFESIPMDMTFDFILTNPPYIDPVLDRAESSVKEHEPHLALYGGHDGMEIIAAIISQAKAHLTPGGQLWIEHEPEQASAIALLAREHGFALTSHHDQYQVIRYSILMLQ